MHTTTPNCGTLLVQEDTERIIPYLPGKKLFSRTNTRAAAVKRQKAINAYCAELLLLPKRIAECKHVTSFFAITDEDIHADKDGDARASKQVASAEEMVVSEVFMGDEVRLCVR